MDRQIERLIDRQNETVTREEIVCRICYNLLNDVDYHLKVNRQIVENIDRKDGQIYRQFERQNETVMREEIVCRICNNLLNDVNYHLMVQIDRQMNKCNKLCTIDKIEKNRVSQLYWPK